jgi:hypothetical protein
MRASVDLTDLELLHGVDEPLTPPRQPEAGALRAALDGATVRRVHHGDRELLRGLYAAVRDPGWDTVPLRLGALAERLDDDGFAFSWDGEADNGTIGMDVRLAIEAASSRLSLRFEAEARRGFDYARVGLNVLLPPHVAGCAYTTGEGHAGVFPTLIAPQHFDADLGVYEALFPSFQQLTIDLPCRQVTLVFTGDEFEVEDQRNWTDASFKVYSTPLRYGYPHQAEAGQRFDQEVVLEIVER